LINFARADSTKTPLILIHGIHGTESHASVTEMARVPNDEGWNDEYWREFIQNSWRDETNGLSRKYQLFVFKYCSDRKSVREIANVLGREIDDKLRGTPHVIVGHSMGGLVAKSYMTEYTHTRDGWTGKLGGDTVLGLVTLATPHHGTPGANSMSALEQFILSGNESNLVKQSKRLLFAGMMRYYWKERYADSAAANRADLRWDNYDLKLGGSTSDVNRDLASRNLLFAKYQSKVIAYGGFLDTTFRPLTILTAIAELNDASEEDENVVWDHKLLNASNFALVRGLNGAFGNTDGMVPLDSGLNCGNKQTLTAAGKALPLNFVCVSNSRVRRFEPGGIEAGETVDRSTYPDTNTLSIYRTRRGFDHLDMFTHPQVLGKLVEDLLSISSTPKLDAPPVGVLKIPTLFLFDVSGSMIENNKIEQARAAGLDALREMRDEGAATSPVSVMTFAGDCNPSSTKRLMAFAPDLTAAENVMRRMLPNPDGATPLPQAKDAAFAEVTRYLDSNPTLKEGRVILLSDGQSTCGEIRPAGIFSRQTIALSVARPASRVRYLTIGFDVPAGSAAERDLQYLAFQTGGKYYNAANRDQLIRSLQKQVRVFVPRACNEADPDFARGLGAFQNYDHAAAVEAFRKYTSVTPGDWCGFYNLALAYEATDRYKKAAQTFRKYLELAPTSPDRVKVEQRILRLQEDYADQYTYFVNLIESDIGYLKNYYQSIFNRTSSDLGEEFGGFVYEKREFYAMLPAILEIDERWLSNDSKDIATSIDVLARRRTMETFDRDAVSLLTLPIAQMQDLVARLRQYQMGHS
jgi:Mg-chelatase subunit ChlD/pimeloyl-ACP methyl ester carboxylesterase